MQISLFYFADDASSQREQTNPQAASERYRLLIEGARFADRHGFTAVWTPERHFHPFGGLYPNPSVTSAALATITERVHLRAGSVVLPLHDPLRVVEEWSVVDNLSGGRVGISFASGWHATDFVLRPDGFKDRKAAMTADIDVVRRLWRGESVSRVDGVGRAQQVTTHPRPVNAELPFWITSSGNVDTFRLAGELGAHVLTHLLGQDVDTLAVKVAAYRETLADKHPGAQGHVTLMIHTFLADSVERARHVVREPFSNYLRSSLGLVTRFAEVVDAQFDPAELSPSDIELLVEHAFERYFATSGLFGDHATVLALARKLMAVGVDELACLIDFGVATDQVLGSLRHLAELGQSLVAETGR